MSYKHIIMKRVLIILIVSFAFLLPVKTWGFGDPIKTLSNFEMQDMATQYLLFIIANMDFLVDTKAASWQAFWDDLGQFRYIRDDGRQSTENTKRIL